MQKMVNLIVSIVTYFFVYPVFSFTSCRYDETRIMGGQEVSIKHFPYLASLQHKKSGHMCGASIISSKHILTAAHCVFDEKVKELVVRVGSTYWNRNGMKIDIKKIYVHENYDNVDDENDIALLKLKEELIFSRKVAPVKLPKKKDKYDKIKEATASGWGLKKEGGRLSRHLNAVNLTVLNEETCNQLLEPEKFKLFEGLFCAGDLKGGTDTCQGDSGGPLVANNKLIGVVSFGFGCGYKNTPGLYTDVAFYKDWIKEKAKI